MTYEEIASLLEQRMADNWVTTTVVVYDNASVDIPDKEPWVRFLITPAVSENRAIGGGETIKEGFVVLQVMVPLNTGSRTAQKAVDDFLVLFENQALGNTLFTYSGSYTRVGEDGLGWYVITANVPFQAT
jgi:hypothetical protein